MGQHIGHSKEGKGRGEYLQQNGTHDLYVKEVAKHMTGVDC